MAVSDYTLTKSYFLKTSSRKNFPFPTVPTKVLELTSICSNWPGSHAHLEPRWGQSHKTQGNWGWGKESMQGRKGYECPQEHQRGAETAAFQRSRLRSFHGAVFAHTLSSGSPEPLGNTWCCLLPPDLWFWYRSSLCSLLWLSGALCFPFQLWLLQPPHHLLDIL